MCVCVCVCVGGGGGMCECEWMGRVCVWGEEGDGVEGRGERLPYSNTRLVVMVCVDIRLQCVDLSRATYRGNGRSGKGQSSQ